MGTVTFLNDEKVSLTATKLVYSPEELKALDSMIDQAKELQRILEGQNERIASAERNGYEAGYEKGRSEGYEAALEHIAVKLVVLAKEADETRRKVERSAGEIALTIVERIAENIGPGQTLLALASSAAKELVPRETIRLRVHPADHDAVRATLDAFPERYQQVAEIARDITLEPGDCVLDTEFGQIKADLATQLKVFREKFGGE